MNGDKRVERFEIVPAKPGVEEPPPAPRRTIPRPVDEPGRVERLDGPGFPVRRDGADQGR